MRRFYFDKQNLKENKIFIFDEEFFHLKNVLRLKVGELVTCFCGDGKNYISEIEGFDKNKATLMVKQIEESDTLSKTDITVFQGTLKLDKFEFVIQKLAELGVKNLVPFESAFSVAKLKQEKVERYKKISVSASKQCGRADFMQVQNKLSFNLMLKQLEQFDKVIFAYENENQTSLKSINFNDLKSKQLAIIVGSEGGFNEIEVEKLKKLKNLSTITLGKRILRAETAVVVLTGLAMFLLDEI